jgi:hypothetical protein
MTSACPSDPVLATGVQPPTVDGDDEDEMLNLAEVEGEDDDNDLDEYLLVAEVSKVEALDPCNLAEAKQQSDWPQWEEGICKELAMLKRTQTWELIDAPAGTNVVGSKWVFHAKKDAAGHIACHKAQLVAQRFSPILYTPPWVPCRSAQTTQTLYRSMWILSNSVSICVDSHGIQVILSGS